MTLLKKYTIITTLLLSPLLALDSSQFINEDNCNQILDKEFFQVCYDHNLKTAKAVSYTLYGDLVNETNIEKRPSFKIDREVEKQYRASTKDYTKSGYDRGHLANDASFDYDKKVVRKTYTMANIIPQAPTVNHKTWIKAEKLERKVAVSLGTVKVLNGVIYSSNPKRIGKNRVAVPDAFWKMIYNDSKNYKKCFYYENDLSAKAKGDKLKSHLVDCSTLN